MVNCSLIEEWDDMPPEDRFDALEEIIHGALANWGMDDVDVVDNIDDPDEPEEYVTAEYDPETKTIHLNPASIDGSDGFWEGAEEAASVVLHEAIHAAQDQLDIPSVEVEAYNLGIVAMREMFEECVSSPDSVPAGIPSYPFKSSELLDKLTRL